MTWKPGECGNPNGRKRGSKNARTRAVLEKLDGKADSLVLLGELVASSEAPVAIRVQAAIGLARYQHAPAPRLIRKSIKLPQVETITDATACIAHIGQLAATRKIGLDEAADLVNIQKAFIEARVSAELEERIVAIEIALAKANINLGIAVEGGLPDLPLGPDDGRLIMPAKLLPLRSQPSELPSDKPPLEPPPTDGDAS
jgi:Family of unknown function (DUF5681)